MSHYKPIHTEPTLRDFEVLGGLAKGLSNREIASQMKCGVPMVKQRITWLRKKFVPNFKGKDVRVILAVAWSQTPAGRIEETKTTN